MAYLLGVMETGAHTFYMMLLDSEPSSTTLVGTAQDAGDDSL